MASRHRRISTAAFPVIRANPPRLLSLRCSCPLRPSHVLHPLLVPRSPLTLCLPLLGDEGPRHGWKHLQEIMIPIPAPVLGQPSAPPQCRDAASATGPTAARGHNQRAAYALQDSDAPKAPGRKWSEAELAEARQWVEERKKHYPTQANKAKKVLPAEKFPQFSWWYSWPGNASPGGYGDEKGIADHGMHRGKKDWLAGDTAMIIEIAVSSRSSCVVPSKSADALDTAFLALSPDNGCCLLVGQHRGLWTRVVLSTSCGSFLSAT